MYQAFQDKENLYLTMDYLGGGDLRYYLIKHTRFSEQKTSKIVHIYKNFNIEFIIANILVALEYVHSQNILHRDIKPENLVFDENGYLKLTDFGISRIWSPKNEFDTSGTPGYMAPEVMMKIGHGMACDLFAVGVIGYECLLGRVFFNF
jgi:serine/threonine protein kinase